MNIDSDILIVDDEAANLRWLSDLLEKEGYQVRLADNPQKAIDSAILEPPGLILLNIWMPGTDSFEFCKHLKQDKRIQHVPIIFICSLSDTEARIRGFEAGAVDFISKPFQEQEVLARVRTHMQLNEMQQNLEKLVDHRTFELTKIKASLEQYIKDLKESEMRFRSVVENANETILVTQDELVKYSNQKVEELIGYSMEEMSTLRFEKFIHPDDLNIVLSEHQTRLSGEKPANNYTIRIITKAGQVKYGFVNSGLINWDGRPAVLAMITDITDLKKKEWNLLQAQKIARLGFYDWDFQKDQLYASEELIRIIGKGFEEEYATSEYISSIVHPDDLDFVRENLELAIKGEKKYEIEHRVLRPDGTVIWVASQAELFHDSNGKPERLIGTGVDITEQKKVQDKLKKSEELFRQLMEQSPWPMVILSPDGKIILVNSAWKKLWKLSEEEGAEVIAKYNMFTDPQYEKLGLTEMVKKAFEGKHTILPPIQYDSSQTADDFNLELLNDFKSPWIQIHLNSVKDEKGQIAYIVSMYMDLTNLKNAEQKIQEQRDLLARMSRANEMGQLTASIAHELNQPLTGILSNAQAAELILKRKHCDLEEIKEIVTDIIGDTKRASEVIRNLRKLYSDQKVEFLPVEISTVIKETVNLLKSELVMQKVNLTTKCDTANPIVKGNKIQIQQVMVNLIMNGIQAMIDMGRNEKNLWITTSCKANEVKVFVTDSGKGINAEIIDTIFEPLATWKPDGTGMGLAICKSIIQAHGGRMIAENRPEGGARIGFILPVNNES